MSKINRYLTKLEIIIYEIIVANGFGFVESEDDFSSTESENDKSIKFILINISNVVNRHNLYSLIW